jgi:O-antigen/teichoic acid export membrane protein
LLKKFLTASVIYSIGPQLPKIAGLVLLPFLTPYLSKTDFGVWGTIMAYALLFSAARDMGMTAPMINSFYKHPTRWHWVWQQINTFLLIFGVIYTIVQVAVLWWIMPPEAVINRESILVMISCQSLFLDIPNQMGARYLQLKEKPLLLSLVSMGSGFIAVGVQCYCVIILKQGYMGWFYSTFCSALFSGIIYVIILYKNTIYPIMVLRFNWLTRHIKLSLPMLPHNYSSYLLNASDRMVMNLNKINTQNIGLYNVAYMWGNYVDTLGNAVGMAVGPIFLKLFSEKNIASERKIFHLTQFLQIAFLVGPFIIALWSKELFLIFIKNPDLRKAYGLSIIIIMGYSYRPLYWNVVSRLQFNDFTNQLWKISLIGGILNLVLNLIFIPIYGYQVAAVTTFIALMYIGFSGFYLKALKKLDSNNYYPLVWFILIVLFTCIAYVLKDAHITVKTALCLVLLLGAFIYIKRNHLSHLKEM